MLFLRSEILSRGTPLKKNFALPAVSLTQEDEHTNNTIRYVISYTRLIPVFNRAFLYLFQISFGKFACQRFSIVLVAERGTAPRLLRKRKEVRT